MKRILYLFMVICVYSAIHAQTLTVKAAKANNISFTILSGISDDSIKSKIERNVNKILTEVNAAQTAGRNLDFSVMDVNSNVQQTMTMLWEVSPFKCTEEEIVEPCLTTGTGYQVRNIPLMMKPIGESEFNDEEFQEAVISFDQQGNVESFYFSISTNLYMSVIKSNLEPADLRHRQMILDYIEQIRTAYAQKDIDFLNQVFCDNDSVLGNATSSIHYIKNSKKQYIENLRRVFQREDHFKAHFDDIEVRRHPIEPDFYGVTVLHGWTSGNYHDEGYLFMLWDFTDENAPQIHVRTWQPSMTNGKPLPKDEIFGLQNIDI